MPSQQSRGPRGRRFFDIEFATDISHSLISQVKDLQAVIVKRDEELRLAKAAGSRLEKATEGLQQRLRDLDESEHRYKERTGRWRRSCTSCARPRRTRPSARSA